MALCVLLGLEGDFLSSKLRSLYADVLFMSWGFNELSVFWKSPFYLLEIALCYWSSLKPKPCSFLFMGLGGVLPPQQDKQLRDTARRISVQLAPLESVAFLLPGQSALLWEGTDLPLLATLFQHHPTSAVKSGAHLTKWKLCQGSGYLPRSLGSEGRASCWWSDAYFYRSHPALNLAQV